MRYPFALNAVFSLYFRLVFMKRPVELTNYLDIIINMIRLNFSSLYNTFTLTDVILRRHLILKTNCFGAYNNLIILIKIFTYKLMIS